MIPSRTGRSKLLWKLFAGYAVLTMLALGVCVLLIVHQFDTFHAKELTDHLRAQAVTLRSQVRGQLDLAHAEELDTLAKEVGGNEADGYRVTLIATDGTVLGDSQADVSRMDSHRDRQEIRAALDSGWGESTRWSNTLGHMLHYVAVRVGSRENPEGTVRIALAMKTIGARTQVVRKMIWTIAMVTMAATILFTLGLTRLWTLPIRRITRIAARLSRGDLAARAPVRGADELARLAQSLNEMGEHLSKQLSTIDGQRQIGVALLDQLQEGVVVAGPEGRIILANPAAARLLHPDDAAIVSHSWADRSVEQCVPQHALQRLLLHDSADFRNGATNEVRVEIPHGSGSVMVLARASDIELPNPQSGGDQPLFGRILALTDITEIARTIQMKTDFVANASHELRTPLSAIRAAIETLINIDPHDDAESARRFLRVIDRHSTRLEALVADLLALSRLESPSLQAKSAVIDVSRFCRELHDKWNQFLTEKQLHWQCDFPRDLREITVDADLLRIVLDNLIDNAIKFTDAGGHIAVSFKSEHDGLVVEIVDDGCGIPSQDCERVFERFYQVAHARSEADTTHNEKRGTGLGLAIVRHAVTSMGGRVTLTSEVDAGTSITISIPRSL